ncbi:MAG: signal peptidase II [Chloroflexi bacterium]|nr:signal peptidase II [Chloroflexota bacterium]MDQ3447903.1 signal peptidase II [Chloroflexota bacterium]
MREATRQEGTVETAARPQARRARRRWALFGLTAVSVVVADQISKRWVDAEFGLAGATAPTPVVGDLVRIAKGYNDGGIFGLFGDSAAILGVASLAVITLILVYQVRQGASSGPLLSLTLGLLLGGAIGNLIDRMVLGHVIDFVDMGIGTLRFYTFNVADAAISVAIALLIVLSLFGDRIPGGAMDTKVP